MGYRRFLYFVYPRLGKQPRDVVTPSAGVRITVIVTLIRLCLIVAGACEEKSTLV